MFYTAADCKNTFLFIKFEIIAYIKEKTRASALVFSISMIDCGISTVRYYVI